MLYNYYSKVATRPSPEDKSFELGSDYFGYFLKMYRTVSSGPTWERRLVELMMLGRRPPQECRRRGGGAGREFVAIPLH